MHVIAVKDYCYIQETFKLQKNLFHVPWFHIFISNMLCYFVLLWTCNTKNCSCSCTVSPIKSVFFYTVFCFWLKKGIENRTITWPCYFGHRGIKWSTYSKVTWSCVYCISAENTDITKIKIGHSSLISKGLVLWRNQTNSKNKWSQVERVKINT